MSFVWATLGSAKGSAAGFWPRWSNSWVPRGIHHFLLNTHRRYAALPFYEKNGFHVLEDLVLFGKAKPKPPGFSVAQTASLVYNKIIC